VSDLSDSRRAMILLLPNRTVAASTSWEALVAGRVANL
jgi:hypothetical protein